MPNRPLVCKACRQPLDPMQPVYHVLIGKPLKPLHDMVHQMFHERCAHMIEREA